MFISPEKYGPKVIRDTPSLILSFFANACSKNIDTNIAAQSPRDQILIFFDKTFAGVFKKILKKKTSDLSNF